MVSALLEGAQKAGAETANVFLAEKQIKHCTGCFSCWRNNPLGQCVFTDDDMSDILSQMNQLFSKTDTNIIILASPLYVDGITSLLKVFLERMIVLAAPQIQKAANGESRHLKATVVSPKLIMMSNCGYPERTHFQVISHWVNRLALNMHTEVIAEIYTTQGALINTYIPSMQPVISNYLRLLEKAGKELFTKMKLSVETEKALAQNFLPDEVYINEIYNKMEVTDNSRSS